MSRLELDLGESGVVAAELVEVEHGAMAGVAEDDRHQGAIGPGDAEDRDVVVVGPLEGQLFPEPGDVLLAIGAAIDGEVAAAVRPGEPGVGQMAQRLSGHLHDGVLEPFRVLGDPAALGVVDLVHRQQVRADDGPAMGVRAGQHDAVASESVALLQRVADPVRHRPIDADHVERDEQGGPAGPGP